MGMAIRAANNDHRALTGEPQLLDKLKELARNGYVPDASDDGSAGILLRHPTGPDLILQPDGTIDLPVVQRAKSPVPAASAPRMFKLRTLMIVVMAALFWFFSVAITASILEGM